MNDKSLFKSQEQHSRETLEPKYTYLRRVKTHDVASLLTCPLCNNVCKEATTINQCNHTFCKECIDTKLQGQHVTCCPTCDLDLSNLSPDDYLRPDKTLLSMIETLGNSVRTEQPKTPVTTPPPSPTGPATFEPANQVDALKADGECGTRVKEQRDKKRKHSQLPSCQNEDEGRGETEHKLEATLESNSAGLYESGTSEEKTIEDSIDELFIEHERRFGSAWFRLVPQEDEKGHFQPMLEKSYIYVKNGDAKVSLIKKLLMMRLNLENEDKVEVCCFGVPLTEDLTFSDLLDCWMNCIITAPQEYIDFLEEEEVELMRLTYRRKKPCYPNGYTMFRLSSC